MIRECIDYLLTWLLQYIPIILFLSFCSLIIFLILLGFVGHKMDNYFLRLIIDLFGLHFLDNSEIALYFRSGLKFIRNNDKPLILCVGRFGKYGKSDSIEWHNIREAVLLIVPNSLFQDGQSWGKLCKLLLCYRNARPLNAMVITYAAEVINKDTQNTVKQLTSFGIDFEYPVYLVLDRLTTVEGWSDFMSILPENERNIVFGWSNPIKNRHNKKMYSPTIVQELAGSVVQHISTQINKIVNLKSVTNSMNHNTILFGYRLQSAILPYLTEMFNAAFYQDGKFFLRGVYLIDSESDSISSDPLLFNLILAEDLSLPRSSHRTYYSTLFGYISISFLAFLILNLPLLHKRLLIRSDKIASAVNGIEQLLSSKDSTSPGTFREFITYLDIMARKRLGSISIPLSWISSLPYKVKSLSIKTYRQIVIRRVQQQFSKVLADSSSDKYKANLSIEETHPLLNTEAFFQMYDFALHIMNLEKTEHSIQNLSKSTSINNLSYAVRKLFNVELPSLYYDYIDIYRKSVNWLPIEVESMRDYKYDFQRILFAKVGTFITYIQSLNGLFNDISLIVANLKVLQQKPDEYRTIDLIRLVETFERVKMFLSSGNVSWIVENDFNPGPRFTEFIDSLCDSSIFGPKISCKVKEMINNSIKQIRERLTETVLPIFGRFIIISDTGIKFSPDIESTITILNELVNLKSLNNEGTTLLNPDMSNIQYFGWNTLRVSNVVAAMNTFQSTINTKLDTIPVELKMYLRKVLITILGQKIETELSASCEQSYSPGASERLFIDIRINNLSNSSMNLITIIDFADQNEMNEMSAKLKKILRIQCDQALNDLYKLLISKAVYCLNYTHILNSIINEKFINDFLKANREELEGLYNKAKPILSILEDLYKLDSSLPKSEVYYSWVQIAQYFTASGSISLQALENFISRVMKCRDLAELTACYNAEQVEMNDNSLLSIRKREILEMVKAKIQSHAIEEVKLIYSTMVDKFNENLKGYFPFADLYSSDVPVIKLHKFYDFWLQNKTKILTTINIMQNNNQIVNKTWYIAVLRLCDSMQWIEHLVEPEKFPASCKVKLREWKQFEVNSNQLSLWRMVFSDKNDYVYTQTRDKEVKTISCDMNVEVCLDSLNQSSIDMVQRISSGSKYRFAVYSDNDNQVYGMSYNSPFSILRLIKRYYDHSQGDDIYLKFEYRLIDQEDKSDSQIKSWIKLTLSGLKYLDFPTEMPNFNE